MLESRYFVSTDGGNVFVESRGDYVAQDGTAYNNVYIFKFVVQDGKIAEVYEYANPLHTPGWLVCLSANSSLHCTVTRLIDDVTASSATVPAKVLAIGRASRLETRSQSRLCRIQA